MKAISILGGQWGDEGKGKVVDWLSSIADVIIRFQGGHNAGHTLTIDNKVYKLSLLPSGIVRPNKISVIGPGVVLDLESLFNEIEKISGQGVFINHENLLIADNIHLNLPIHRLLDQIREGQNGKIGTTKKGIGPTYEDKIARRSIRLIDIFYKHSLCEKLEILTAHHKLLHKERGAFTLNDLYDWIMPYADKIHPFMCDLQSQYKKWEDKKILFEGAQGAMLDISFGTYPFVTSSNTISGAINMGACFGGRIDKNISIVKAYTTRVGDGPFPTEQDNEVGEKLGRLGHEFGTVTNRKRRCGWLDLAMVKRAIEINGSKHVVLTKLDVLDNFAEIKVGVGYMLDGKEIDYFPHGIDRQNKLEVKYKSFTGWQENTKGIRKFDQLPKLAKEYISFIENYLECNIIMISTSPEREDIITSKSPYED